MSPFSVRDEDGRVVGWSPADWDFCPDALAYLLLVYLGRPLRPLPFTPATLWDAALRELRPQMTGSMFHFLLAGSRVVPTASTPLRLTVAVPNPYAVEWLNARLQPAIDRALVGLAGYPMVVLFVSSPMRNSDCLSPASP